MAAAYAAIANDGVYNAPHFVTKVEDRDGNVLYEHEPSAVQAISTDVARRATVALSAVVTGGTYRGGSLPDRRPAAGKTGTNELDDGGNADVWFVGYTPQMATAVWIGDPAGSIDLEGGRVQGGTAAGSVWREFMFPYLEGTPVIEFPEPDSWGRSSYIRDPWNRYSSRSEYSSGSSSSRNRNRWSGSSGGGSATTTTIASNDDDDGGTGGGGGGTGGGGGGDGGDGGGGTGGGGGVDPPAPDGGDE
jgi:membrane peptidoglycan carboxypeptidase